MSVTITPLSSLRVSRHLIPAHAGFPNTSLKPHPLLIYHQCFHTSTSTSSIQSHLRSVGVVEPAWTYSMYKQHHYHSTTHEVLVVVSGNARLFFGGQGNPEGVRKEVKKGDVMILPAGTGHAMEEDLGGFSMVGSYPVGADNWDHCTGGEGKEAEERIKGLKWFTKDPIYGSEGPTLDTHWRSRGGKLPSSIEPDATTASQDSEVVSDHIRTTPLFVGIVSEMTGAIQART